MKNYNNKIKINNFNTLINVLENIPKKYINMEFEGEELFKNKNSFGYLILLVIKEIPEMKNFYLKHKKKITKYKDIINILCKYLGFYNQYKFDKWKREKPEIWGKGYRNRMFYSPKAFCEEEYKIKVTTIISKLKKVRFNLLQIKEKRILKLIAE